MRSRLLFEWLFVSILAIGTVVMATATGLVARGDHLLYDSLIRFSPHVGRPNIAIVAIDEASLSEVGAWPWPRSVQAELIRRLTAAKPLAIGYDVLFVEPRDGDDAVAAAFAENGRVLLPVAFTVPGADGRAFDPQLPVPSIKAGAHALGQAAVAFDDDGIVRRAGLVAGGGDEHWAHLGELLYRTAYGHDSPAFSRAGGEALPARAFTIGAPQLVRFGPLGGLFPTVPFSAVLRGEVPPEFFRGRIVLVGNTAAGSGDQYPVPASGGTAAMPGVEILANVVEGLTEDNLIRPAGDKVGAAFTLVPLALLLVALLRLPPRVNLLIGVSLIFGLLAASALLLRLANLWVAPTGGLIALAIVYPLWAWRRLVATSAFMSRELRELRHEPDFLPGNRTGDSDDWMLSDPVAEQTDLLRRAIDRVRDLRQFFADSLQSLPDPTLVLDTDGCVMVANQAAHDLFGPGAGLDEKPPQTLQQMLAGIARERLGPIALSPTESRELITRDGRILVLGIAPLASAESRNVGWIARLGDISEIRLATRQREEALQLLTHDMRSPQASILAVLEKGADDRVAQARIAGYARRTLALADSYVQLARAESATYAEDVLDFASLLIEAADDQWTLANRRNIDIVTADDGREHLLVGDHSLLSRVLVNLINNAVKYSPDGGTIRCSVASPLPAPDPADPRPMLLCRIEDEGPGIPPERIETVFERFRTYTGDRNRLGAGLGLAFVQTVVERHGGTVACANRPEGGALFTLALPLAAHP